jgi:hypothetical protein
MGCHMCLSWYTVIIAAVLAFRWMSLLLLLLLLLLLQNFVRSTEFFSRVAVIYGAYKATQLKAAVMRLQGSSAEPRVKVRRASMLFPPAADVVSSSGKKAGITEIASRCCC